MSREINYRAWDNDKNEWLNEADADLLTIHLDGTYEIDRGWVVVYPDLTLEQDTGLKDKNGKKIFEGDIVKILDAPVLIDKALVVKFDEFYIGEYNCAKMTGWIVQVANGEWISSLADENSCCVVIGNIHENPDLLGGEK